MGKEMLVPYESNLKEAIERGEKEYSYDFFVVVLTKKERLLHNVIRNYFMTRATCPTPEYDQAVWYYHRESGLPEFIWVVPSKDACMSMRTNALMTLPEEKELLNFVLEFYDGTLLVRAKKLNNELGDEPNIVLYKKEEDSHGRK